MVDGDLISPFPEDVDRDQFGHWLAGFADGESCFQIWSARVGRWSRGGASFVIDLRADDHSILSLIQAYWQCGKIRAGGSRVATYDDGKTKRTYTVKEKRIFRVDAMADLERVVIPHFERYPLRAKKARDFVVWKRGVILLNRIIRRPRRVRPGGYGSGTYPKWTADEWREFKELVAVMKQQRQFETGGRWLPMPTPAKESASLF